MLFMFQKIKNYSKGNRYIKLKNLMKVLLANTKQNRLQKVESNEKILTMRKRSYRLPNLAVFRSYLP